MTCLYAQFACIRCLQTAEQSEEAEWARAGAAYNLWNSLSDEERCQLLTFKQSELHKQAVKQTRMYIESVKGAALHCSVRLAVVELTDW